MFTLNQKRFNIYAPYEAPDGTRYGNLTDPVLREQLGVVEIPDPQAPADYSQDTYYRTEQDDAPYVVYTRKSDEQIAAARWEAIKIIRDDLLQNGGCLVGGLWFHTDVYSKQQQMALTMLGANIPPGLRWKTMSGVFVEMVHTLAAAIFAAQVQREQTIFAIAEAKRVDDSPLREGWPDRYTEQHAVEITAEV
jgi:hypothetical protein